MPLLNSTIIRLNEITSMVEDKSQLTLENESFIKEIFKKINENGERYDVDEIESWFENEGSWKNKDVRTRIVNICLLYTSPSPRDRTRSRMPSSA